MLLDGVWNLALACRDCNRGKDRTANFMPAWRFLESLNTRIEFRIVSHRPLGETVIAQPGRFPGDRAAYVNFNARYESLSRF